jgi:heterodisulfide reductase subunit A-like polyferredoxin
VAVLPYLGFKVNLAAGTFRVLPAKLQRIHAMLDGVLAAGAVSGPLLESLICGRRRRLSFTSM